MSNKVYVVKRSFKSGGTFYPAGSIVENPAGIRLFKSILKDGRIVEVTEQNLDKTVEYFRLRMGLDIEPVLKEGLLGSLPMEPDKGTTEPLLQEVGSEEDTAPAPETTEEATAPVVSLFGSSPTKE